MTKEDKQLLLTDLCARLPYGVKAQVLGLDEEKGEIEISLRVYSINTDGYVYFEYNDYDVDYLAVDACRLYLRPMSSMTEDEQKEFVQFHCVKLCPIIIDDMLTLGNESKMFDWLNAHHFDFRGLIDKSLAIEAPKGMYRMEEQQ